MQAQETRLEYLLEQVHTRLLVMCATVEAAVEGASAALGRGDMERGHLVIESDAQVDRLENEIDEMALSILARTQPVARDLRFVVSTLRMVVDLERIGDEAVGIAERAALLRDLPRLPAFEQIMQMAQVAQKALHDAITAFRDGNSALALQVCRGEDDISQLEVHLLQNAMRILAQYPDGIHGGWSLLHVILIAHSLNRIFRRASNIAEQTYFMVEGVNLKHRSLM